MYLIIFQHILFEAFFDIFYAPIWWYTAGARRAVTWTAHLVEYGNETLAPGLWLKNLFVPMFGQYDWQGRLVSFFMRLIQIIVRTLALLIWFVICLALLLVWFVLPVVIIYGFFMAVTMVKHS